MAAIHAALVQAGLGAAADKITTLMELSKKAQRTGIQQEFFDSCNTFDSPQQRIHRAALFIDDALHGRTLKVQRLTPWAVWIYKLEQSSTFSSIMLCCDLLFLYCSVFAPLLRPHTIKKNDMGLSPIDYPSSQLYVELACLLMFTLQLSLTLYHSYGAVFFRIVDKHMVPVFMNITNAIMLFIFWLDFLICVVGRADHPRYVMPLWIFRFFHDLRPGVPSTFWAIITCVPILDVILLILLILVMFAFYGVTLFHGLYDSSEWQHFDSMGPAMLSLYILMTGDNVPDILTPALTEPLGSLDNVYFFILFCLAASFFVLPIPLAVILESFKVNRAQQVIVSEVTEKKALLAAFHCLDAEKKGTLTRGEFSELIHFIYTDTSAIKIMMELFDLIDEDGSGELDQLEFFTLSDSITYTLRYASVHVEEIQRSLEQALRRLQRIFSGQGRKGEAEKTMSSGSQRSNSTSDSTWRSNISRSEDGTTRKRVRSNRKSYHERFGTTNAFGSSMQENHVSCCTKCCVIPSICWLKWRLFADVKLRLARLVFSPWFEGGIMLVVLVNSVFIGVGMNNTNSFTNIPTFSFLFLGIYIVEAFLKISGIGYSMYIRDSWNFFDFCLIVIGIGVLVLQLMTAGDATASAAPQDGNDLARLTRSTKLIRTFRAAKGLRVLRLARVFSQLSKLFTRIKNFMVRFGVVASSVKNAFAVMFVLLWIFSIFGYLLFNGTVPRYIVTSSNTTRNVTASMTATSVVETSYAYQNNLNTPGDAFVVFFWIALQHNWSDILFNVLDSLKESAVDQKLHWGLSLSIHFFFISAHFMLAIVMASLCVGIVWEVFAVLGSTGEGEIMAKKNVTLIAEDQEEDQREEEEEKRRKTDQLNFSSAVMATVASQKLKKNLVPRETREARKALQACKQTDKKLFLKGIPKEKLIQIELEALEDFGSVLGMDLHEVYRSHFLKEERRTNNEKKSRNAKQRREQQHQSLCVCVHSAELGTMIDSTGDGVADIMGYDTSGDGAIDIVSSDAGNAENAENTENTENAGSKESQRRRLSSLKDVVHAQRLSASIDLKTVTRMKDVVVRISTLFPMGTPREIHSTTEAKEYPPKWNQWLTFSDDASGLVGVDAIEIRVFSAGSFGRSRAIGSIVLSLKEMLLEVEKTGGKRRLRKWHPIMKSKVTGGQLVERTTGRIDLEFVFKQSGKEEKKEKEKEDEKDKEEKKEEKKEETKEKQKNPWQKALMKHAMSLEKDDDQISLPSTANSSANSDNSDSERQEDETVEVYADEEEDVEREAQHVTPHVALDLASLALKSKIR